MACFNTCHPDVLQKHAAAEIRNPISTKPLLEKPEGGAAGRGAGGAAAAGGSGPALLRGGARATLVRAPSARSWLKLPLKQVKIA